MVRIVQWWIRWAKEVFTFIVVLWVFVLAQMINWWPM